MEAGLNLIYLKVILVLFWALWLTVMFLINLFDNMKRAGLLSPEWRFSGRGYEIIARTTAIYSAPIWLNRFLFVTQIVWQAVAALLFWRALFNYFDIAVALRRDVYQAFAVSLGLWGSYILADEIFQNTRLMSRHVLVFIAQLVTLLAIHILPF